MSDKHENHVPRSVVIPVSFPADGMNWEALDAKLKECFNLSTHAANWCVQQLYKRDTIGQAKTPQEVKPRSKTNPNGFYAYGQAQQEDWAKQWDGAKQSLGICLRTAHAKYLGKNNKGQNVRFEAMVRHNQNVLTFRYPFPYPVHNQSVTLSYADNGFPRVDITLPGLGKAGLVLARSKDFGRQLGQFRQMVEGKAKHGEVALYRDRKGKLLCKIVGYFPRQLSERNAVAFLCTDPSAMLVADIIDGIPTGEWGPLAVEVRTKRRVVWNCDHIRRWIASHKTYLQRASEDGKRENRMDRRQRQHMNKSREDRCDKNNDRIDTALHQLSAQVVRFCQRQKVGAVAYDDTLRTYIPDMPYYKLKDRLRYKL